ncbi:malonyl-ACP O-methyltransferase BioC [Magnetofaba australis]|uniref:malonyl-ACP O-methyltransferase BioC n=1 Tax=Magnetofaba australis TaxID=1472297 RepID=UPI000A19ECE6|nr:malonyl-ACP O-methyltransferase BioC [Magnetofaba australis]
MTQLFDPSTHRRARRNKRVAHAFSKAHGYHQRALTQRHIAEELDAQLEELELPNAPRVLEIGCGTGFLSAPVLRRWPQGDFLFTDISPNMLNRARAHLGGLPGRRQFVAMDGEQCALKPGFDLIVSSMAFQWFADLASTLTQLVSLLNPGGHLAFATLGAETFQEWRRACARQSAACGSPHFPTLDDMEKLWPAGGEGWLDEERVDVQHPSAHAFLRCLRDVGAHRSTLDHRPLSAATMRRLLRAAAARDGGGGFSVTYHVLYGIYTRDNDLGPIH